MTDVYRVSGHLCPTCPSSPMREFQHRLVCDECDGMLIELADFRSACADTAGVDVDVEAKNLKPSTKACPQCARAMATCELAIGKLDAYACMVCDQHGLWLSRDVMTGAFAKLARKYWRGQGGPYFDAAGGHTRRMYQSSSGAAATDGLTITRWRDRPRKRAKTLTPINAYADQSLRCPACSVGSPAGQVRELVFAGDRWSCEHCHGLFVQTAALVALVQEMTGEPWQAPAFAGAPGRRPCAVCTVAMIETRLDGVTIDHCEAHGLWFDPKELETVLVAEDRVVHPTGIRGWLRRLF